MKIIITESHDELILYLRRRIVMFERILSEMIENDNPCWYENKSDYIDILLRHTLMDVSEYEDGSEIFESLMTILTKLYSTRLEKIYMDADCDE